MPKTTEKILESRRYFIENVVLKAFEENNSQPARLRQKTTRIVDQLSFMYAHSEASIWAWLRQHKKEKQTEMFKKECK